MDESVTVMEARINRLENHENRMNETTTNVADEHLRRQDNQDDTKVVATGFHATPQRKIEKQLTSSIFCSRTVKRKN